MRETKKNWEVYIPDHYRSSEPRAIIRRYPFGLLISAVDLLPFATSVPLYFETDAEDCPSLIGHMARHNPHAQMLETGQKALAIFSGPNAYVSSGWYVDRPTVPTWNYLAAHLRGTIEMIDDDERQMAIMARTIACSERDGGSGWAMADAPDGKVEQLTPHIRSFRIAIERIDGIEKLSQTHPPADQQRVIDALGRRRNRGDAEISELMKALHD